MQCNLRTGAEMGARLNEALEAVDVDGVSPRVHVQQTLPNSKYLKNLLRWRARTRTVS